MKQIIPYLTFDGNCREAMTFYKQCLGGDLNLMSFADVPCDMPAEAKTDGKRIMHAALTNGPATLMASDSMPGMPGPPLQNGTNFSVTIACESRTEIETIFKALAEKGNVTMPLQDTFWGAHFGMLTDQFGIQWMLNYDLPKQDKA